MKSCVGIVLSVLSQLRTVTVCSAISTTSPSTLCEGISTQSPIRTTSLTEIWMLASTDSRVSRNTSSNTAVSAPRLLSRSQTDTSAA